MKLYPCPCCGSTDIEEEDCSNMQTNGTRIACNDCGLQVEGYGATDCTRKAIRAWNRREYEARILAQCDRLAEAAKIFLDDYIAFIDSGDAGNWDPRKEPKVIALQAALAELDKEEQS